MRALPPGGLREADERISLKCDPGGDERLPVASTCDKVLHLPNYSCPETLARQLTYALDEYEAGGGGFHMR
eukprot:5997928-Prymnesium_polylepis.1